MSYGQYDGPDKPDKGLEGGSCQRAKCQAPGAIWYHHLAKHWYCANCKFTISSDESNRAHWEKFCEPTRGHPLFETREMIDAREPTPFDQYIPSRSKEDIPVLVVVGSEPLTITPGGTGAVFVAPDGTNIINLELLNRLKYCIDAPTGKEFAFRKSSLTRHDVRTIIEFVEKCIIPEFPDKIKHALELVDNEWEWLCDQLVQWPKRVHPDRTTSHGYLSESAAAIIRAFMTEALAAGAIVSSSPTRES